MEMGREMMTRSSAEAVKVAAELKGCNTIRTKNTKLQFVHAKFIHTPSC